MRLMYPTRGEVNRATDQIYERAFKNYISPKVYESKIKKGYRFVDFNFLGHGIDSAKDKIIELLWGGHKVTCGYMATANVRGFHDHYIIWKP